MAGKIHFTAKDRQAKEILEDLGVARQDVFVNPMALPLEGGVGGVDVVSMEPPAYAGASAPPMVKVVNPTTSDASAGPMQMHHDAAAEKSIPTAEV